MNEMQTSTFRSINSESRCVCHQKWIGEMRVQLCRFFPFLSRRLYNLIKMDLVARKKLNLEVLKRHDANICDILDQSAHAVVYKFDTEKTSWVK